MKESAKDPKGIYLGRDVKYSKHYDAGLLFRIERPPRSKPGFQFGFDRWLSYELTWLTGSGAPQVSALEITIPASSSFIVESKSLKLYLGSFALEKINSTEELISTIKRDLVSLLECGEIELSQISLNNSERLKTSPVPGISIDCTDTIITDYTNPSGKLLAISEEVNHQLLNTSAFRSLCPVTEQPDYATVLIDYSGKTIDREALLRYLGAYRNHAAFHESCCENIFEDILKNCKPSDLTVACFFNRRGGIEINPLRSTLEVDRLKYRLRFARQ